MTKEVFGEVSKAAKTERRSVVEGISILALGYYGWVGYEPLGFRFLQF